MPRRVFTGAFMTLSCTRFVQFYGTFGVPDRPNGNFVQVLFTYNMDKGCSTQNLSRFYPRIC